MCRLPARFTQPCQRAARNRGTQTAAHVVRNVKHRRGGAANLAWKPACQYHIGRTRAHALKDAVEHTQDKEYHLKTMAALYTDASVDKRQVEFETDEEFKAYIDRMTEKNSYRQIPSDDIDKLWSFITCSYEFNDARTILYAYEVEDK